ncbi:hypothetical protein BACCIP111899_03885 [Bacillus rhizoplanae]|uniref:Uncharacterized protein n=1 Tax=Bacillus rhizoplanae TaxID=2880966 RepID=A0ABM8YFP0_9BACI|nr:hypothetical protein BACCIP111899_03885 [Bacillus rhizoplanae]
MEKKIKKMMMDLTSLMSNGEVRMDVTDIKYYQMLCGALEATGRNYDLYVHEQDESTLLFKLK